MHNQSSKLMCVYVLCVMAPGIFVGFLEEFLATAKVFASFGAGTKLQLIW